MQAKIKSPGMRLRSLLERRISSRFVSDFLSGLSIVFFFNSLSFFLQFCILIAVAKVWGPVLYGKINLIGNITALLFIPFSMGINNAMYRFLPETDEGRHGELIDSAVAANLVNTVLFAAVFLAGGGLITGMLRIATEIWIYAVLYSATTNLVCVSESFLRGKKRFSDIGRLRLLSSVMFFCSVMFLIFVMKKQDLLRYYIFYSLFYGLVFISLVFYLLKISLVRFDRKICVKICRYGFIMMTGLLLTAVLYNSDIIILNYFTLDKEKVGIFASYQGIIKLVFYVGFHEIFAVVFLPTIAGMDKKILFHRLKKISAAVFAAVFAGSVLLISATLFVFGDRYVFSPLYLLLTSASISVFAVYQIFNTLISIEGEKGARISVMVSLTVFPVSFALQILFTRLWGVTGLMAVLIITNLCLLGMLLVFSSAYYRKPVRAEI